MNVTGMDGMDNISNLLHDITGNGEGIGLNSEPNVDNEAAIKSTVKNDEK